MLLRQQRKQRKSLRAMGSPSRKGFLLRLPVEVHATIKQHADRDNVTMSVWIMEAIFSYLSWRERIAKEPGREDEPVHNKKWWN